MVIFVKSARPLQGKFNEALKWAQKMAKASHRLKDKAPNVRIMRNHFSDLNCITWVQEFDSLTHLDTYLHSFRKHSSYTALVNQHKQLFDTNSITESILEDATS